LLTTYFLKCIAEDIFKHNETSTIPYDLFIGLSSTTPSVDGTGVTEPLSTTGYARVEIDNSNLIFDEADDSGVVSNHTHIYFPESVLPWDGITHYIVYDAANGGNLLMYGELNDVINVPIRTVLSIPAGTLQISAGNGGL